MGWADPRPEAQEWYWTSAYDVQRERLLDAIQKVTPRFTSVLEIGSHCGPVRRRLRERFGSGFRYHGLDCNAMAVSDGQRRAADDLQATFMLGTVPDDLPRWPARSVDIVLSSGCLTCVEPVLFQATLLELKRIAALAVVVQEPYGDGQALPGQGWAHRYPDWVVTC